MTEDLPEQRVPIPPPHLSPQLHRSSRIWELGQQVTKQDVATALQTPKSQHKGCHLLFYTTVPGRGSIENVCPGEQNKSTPTVAGEDHSTQEDKMIFDASRGIANTTEHAARKAVTIAHGGGRECGESNKIEKRMKEKIKGPQNCQQDLLPGASTS